MNHSCDAIVIGTGFGGLGTALALSEKGYKVQVFETLRYPGGCAGTFQRKGYRFEAGATLSSGFGNQQLFQQWITRYQLPVQLEWLDTLVKFRSQHITLDIHSERQSLIEQLCALNNAPRRQILAFFEHQKKVADCLWQLFDHLELLPPWNLNSLWEHFKKIPQYLALIPDVNSTLLQVLKRFKLDQFTPLKIYLDALCQITVQGSCSQIEAPFALATMDYYFRGTAHVVGGIGYLAESLVSAIEMCGGQVHLSNRVKSIGRDSNYSWKIETRKGSVTAPIIVANLLPNALKKILDPKVKQASWIDQCDRKVQAGWGAAMLYCVAKSPYDGPAEHWQMVADESQDLLEGNHVFCSISSAQETNKAPKGSRSMTLSTHVNMQNLYQQSEADQGQYIRKIQENMRSTFNLRCPQWSDAVYFAMTASPRTFERFTGRIGGYVGGIPKRKGISQYFQLKPRAVARGLYLTGDSVFPGQSTLATASGGTRLAQHISTQHKMSHVVTPLLTV